jgi:hypothetical protein
MIGPTATQIDVSCQLVGGRITTNIDEGDSVTTLCGTTETGARTFDHEFSGNMLTDSAAGTAGLFDYSWTHMGEEVEFEYIANTAEGTSAAGKLIITPLDFGADAFGDPLDSDFTWAIVGKPTFTYATTP